MTYTQLLADDFTAQSNDTDSNDKKSFAKEITEKNKEIREQYKIIVRETFTKGTPDSPKKTSKKKK